MRDELRFHSLATLTIDKMAEKQGKKEEKRRADEVYLEERIDIPSLEGMDNGSIFSWRKLWLFTGPGWLSMFHVSASPAHQKMGMIIFRFFFQ